METICLMKAQQCEETRKALLDSEGKILIHNMETGEKWDFGINGKGEDKFGTALENIKHKIINDPTLIQQKSNPITSSQVNITASNDDQTNTPPDHELIIITDSILSEIDQ